MAGTCDVAIIGAGAAGLGAARALSGHGLGVILLDARDRLGGRAHTVTLGEGLPLDRGCGWLHSADRNPLAPLVEAAGFAIDRTRPAWSRQSFDLGFPKAEQEAFAAAFDAFEERLEAAAATGEDASAADCFEPGGRWNPLMDAVSSYYNGAEYDRVSVIDYARYVDTGVNWRVRDGYGAGLLALASTGARAVLDCAVSDLALTAEGVAIETARGTLHARRAIVAVPTPHLASGRVSLPREASDKADLAAGLPLGLANKVFLALDAADVEALPSDGHLFGRTDRAETGSYHLRPFGRPYIECFLGGRHARTLEEAGEGAAGAFAVEELTALLGADLGRRLRVLGETAWGQDPYALGSYSHAEPGRAEDREALAQPVADRLFFAGEATHPQAFSTAHGAWETGLRAAREVLASLGATR
ncbi:flavin monoamine oxidase family protein [Antarcticirhabdus aurantiaca]|uniref:NAD(P)/FAD-dependent oxidoreductase n=1 Tax=Antarcticirhabdus aurantiaca TaxID=2606717 RepID=A0ACD4NK89_9HYPH|nr:NAD(P)/FAD-dependent oxidoreductase [Antarcticirhabdus aurantiaca]WAJ27191.1 NAD(P)/FAD-dependent oxidoreductase [Jeongeuplla avenae]